MSEPGAIDVSLVILNYNVKDFLDNCLASVWKAREGLSTEIFVVDNASVDGSVAMVRQKYPDVHVIVNEANVGFARGNNVALKKCRGRYILVLNPDTLLQEDSLRAMLAFMEAHPEAGAASCKVLNPDGTLQLTCKRSFPTPWVAFTKISGLSRLFPKHRLFGRYNLTYLDENQVHEVDAIAGSFMFLRRTMLDVVGYLDESFFMYGEDLDWCFRIWEKQWKIFYVPSTQIIHYKGESTSRSGFDDIRAFYEAMEIFVEKHFKWQYTIGMVAFLKVAIWSRAALAVLSRFFRMSYAWLLDLALINLSVALGIYVKYQAFITPDWIGSPAVFYSTIHATASVVWIGLLAAMGNYSRRALSISQSLVASVMGFFVVSTLSLFSKDFVFSRLSLLTTSSLVTLFVVTWRVMALLIGRRGTRSSLWSTKVFKRNTLIVGCDGPSIEMAERLRARFDSPYHVVGHVPVPGETGTEKQPPVIGDLETITSAIRQHRITEVILASTSLSNQEIMRLIQLLSSARVNVKLIPRGSEVVIGKSHITRINTVTMIALESDMDRAFSRIIKRLFDMGLCVWALPLLFPSAVFAILTGRARPAAVRFSLPESGIRQVKVLAYADGRISRWSLCWLVWTGRLSFVGTRFDRVVDDRIRHYSQKPGLFSLAEATIPEHDESPERITLSYDNYYAQNHSLKMDIEIMVRALLKL